MIQTIRQIVRSFGFDVIRYTAATSRDKRFYRTLDHFGVNLVFDVGANTGGFAEMVFALGYRGRLVSFEPLISAHAAVSKAAKGNANWTVAERCALGETVGEIEINVSKNSVSSSILPMLANHTAAAPESAYISKEKTPIYTLDSVAGKYLKADSIPLLKIDTQGFEAQVLNGAVKTLPKIKVIQLEMSFVPLYEGQMLYDDLVAWLKAHGFELYSLACGLTDEQTGKMLQADGIFVRK